jgi:putative CocE/NonD family hydrolase
VGNADFGPEALLDTNSILLRWFDHWLKDSGGFSAEPRVRHFVLGENRWRNADTFPTESKHILYLHSAGNANSRKGDGALSSLPPQTEEPGDVFVSDPEVPVPAPGGPSAQSGQFDQAALELGNNLLVYTSEPLTAPLRIFGIPQVIIYCATSLENTDLVAKLARVRPNGVAEFICIGIARSGWLFRESGYKKDEVQGWRFPLEPTSCAFDRGDRIRLEVAGSAFPLYDKNPGSNVPSCLATSWDWARSTQFIFHTGEWRSALYLPVSEAAS